MNYTDKYWRRSAASSFADGVLQCATVCCSALQCIAMCCSVLQCVAVCCSVLQCVAVYCNVLQCVAVCCSESLAAPLQEIETKQLSAQEIHKIFICRVEKCRFPVSREALETREEDGEGLSRERQWRFSVSREADQGRRWRGSP